MSGVVARYWKPGEDFLQNTFHFPSFKNLPHENGLEYGYWMPDHLGVYNPSCIWFFMAEITNDETSQIHALRNRILVRDRDGGGCPVLFYPDPEDLEDFDFKTLKKGSTILVTNGQKHDFMDLSVGLRIEDLDKVSVVPCCMSDLLQLSSVHHTKDAKCWSCGVQDISITASGSNSSGADGKALKKCSACKMVRYCSKDCQKKDWIDIHKRTCKAVPIFQKLTLIDFMKCDDRAFLRL